VNYLIDAQLPPALAHWFREIGCESQTVREIGLREADDGAIWRYAAENRCVIVSKDEDFALRVQASEFGPGVVWLRVGNTSNAALRSWLIPRMP